ncbi:MAG: phosphoribosylanthranilate isomerase [Defluviitaleaceae bacterium]|nr:phosphoribosylanthranilate isomerase [Defluviitaleaceae bacterium]
MKVKICGLTRLEDIEAVNALKPDYIGFVFAESRRKISPESAKDLRNVLCGDIITVGVFVNESMGNILTLINAGIIDFIQLHGAEDENYIAELKSKISRKNKIIKAVSIQKKGDAQAWENSSADFLLLDHKGGGTGEVFDWNLIGEVKKPFFLAGGLSEKNISEAKNFSPYALDVSSGVEDSFGFKCREKIRDFIKGMR